MMLSVRMNSVGYRWVKKNKDGRIKNGQFAREILELKDALERCLGKYEDDLELFRKGFLNKLR